MPCFLPQAICNFPQTSYINKLNAKNCSRIERRNTARCFFHFLWLHRGRAKQTKACQQPPTEEERNSGGNVTSTSNSTINSQNMHIKGCLLTSCSLVYGVIKQLSLSGLWGAQWQNCLDSSDRSFHWHASQQCSLIQSDAPVLWLKHFLPQSI